MRIFNLLNLQLTSLLSISLILSACQLPKPEQRKDGQQTAASFYIDNLSSDLLETQLDEKISIPKAKKYRITACLKDIKQSKPILNSTFEISTGITVDTDTKGCINWQEKLEFNSFSEPKYLEINRDIRAVGLHQGQTQAQLAINPWVFDKSIPEFIDLSHNQVSPLIKGKENVEAALKATSADFENTNNLWIDDGRLFASENDFKKGVNIAYEIKVTPQVIIKSVKGEKTLLPLTYGKFKGSLTLMNSIGDIETSKKVILAKGDIVDGKFDKNVLSIRSTLHLNFIPDRGQNYLILNLIPQDAPKELKPLNAVFFIGEYDQIKSTAFLKVNAQMTEQLNKAGILNSIDLTGTDSTVINSDNKTHEAYQKAKIEIAPLEFRFVRVANETNTDRNMIFNIKACLKNGIDQKPLRGHTFKIQKLSLADKNSPVVIEQKTDNNSCLSWDESVSIRYWECQHFLKGDIKISNDSLGMDEKLEILVNPWEFWGLMARDARYTDPNILNPTDCDKKNQNAQLILDGVSMNTASFRYELDQNMNLILYKKLKFNMSPHVLMHSNLALGRRNNEGLRDGIYLLRMAIVKNVNYRSDYNLIAHQDQLVAVTDGHIMTEVEFKITDLKSIGDRNSFIVELFPVRENLVESNNFGKLKPINNLSLLDIVNFDSGLMSQPVAGLINLSQDDGFRAAGPLNWSRLNEYLINPNYKELKNESLIGQILKNEKVLPQSKIVNYNSVTYAQKDNLNVISLKYDYTYKNLLTVLGIDVTELMRFRPVFDSQFTNHYQNYKVGTKPASLSVLKNAIETGKINESLARSLCVYWFNELLPGPRQDNSILVNKASGALTEECIRSVKTNVADFFRTEKKYFVYKSTQPQQLPGLTYAMNVGVNFNLINSSSETMGSTISGSANAGLKIPFGKTFGDFLSAGANVSYQISKGEQDSNTNSNSVSVGFGTALNVDDLSFKVQLQQYEQCLAIRLNPMLFIKNYKSLLRTRSDFMWVFNDKLSDDAKLKLIRKGIMLCPGEISKKPVEKIEKFYVLNQELRQSYSQDNANPLNRNFFSTLRGKKDFERFVNQIKGKIGSPDNSSNEDNTEHMINENLKKMLLLAPSYPGVYSE